LGRETSTGPRGIPDGLYFTTLKSSIQLAHF
jgi:hypothetical protein